MSLEFNAENRNTGFAVPARRCCSLCRNSGHNVSTCNDSRLLEFQNLCLTIPPMHFREWLEEYSRNNPIIVKAYSSRYCTGNNRHMFACIDNIVTRIGQLNEELHRLSRSEQRAHNNRINLERQRALTSIYAIYNTQPVNEILITTIINEYLKGNVNIFNIETSIVECTNNIECECGICYDNKEKQNFIKLNCGHEFCKDCIKQSMKNFRTEYPQCAFCRREIKHMELSSQKILNEFKYLV